jgi:hypothetical protein
VKVTVKGTVPEIGVALNLTTGSILATTMKFGRVIVSLPAGPLTVRPTV